jgi:hypothetical protein
MYPTACYTLYILQTVLYTQGRIRIHSTYMKMYTGYMSNNCKQNRTPSRHIIPKRVVLDSNSTCWKQCSVNRNIINNIYSGFYNRVQKNMRISTNLFIDVDKSLYKSVPWFLYTDTAQILGCDIGIVWHKFTDISKRSTTSSFRVEGYANHITVKSKRRVLILFLCRPCRFLICQKRLKKLYKLTLLYLAILCMKVSTLLQWKCNAFIKQNLVLLHVVQTGSGIHPTSYTMGTGSSFPGVKRYS